MAAPTNRFDSDDKRGQRRSLGAPIVERPSTLKPFGLQAAAPNIVTSSLLPAFSERQQTNAVIALGPCLQRRPRIQAFRCTSLARLAPARKEGGFPVGKSPS
jgi:hypothetical protein